MARDRRENGCGLMNKKTLVIVLAAVLVLGAILCVVLLGAHPAALEVEAMPSAEAVGTKTFSAAETESAEEPAGPVCSIALNGDSVSIDGPGAKASGSIVTITQNGDYYLSGKLEDGQIIVDAGKEDDDVRLHLNGADITYSQGAAIYVVQAGKVYIEPEAGTENFVADTKNYVFAEGEDEPDAAIFSKDDLIFDGEGTLTVTGSYDMAIHGKDDVAFARTGTYYIYSVGDGVKGKDSVEIHDVTLEIDAGEDGIQSNNAKEEGRGTVTIGGKCDIVINAGKDGIKAESHLAILDSENVSIHAEDDGMDSTWGVQVDGGSVTVIAEQDGIQAGSELNISGGTLEIVTGGGAENGPEHTEEFGPPGWFQNADTDETVSAKGLKSDGDITISGGSINIDSMDDAVHCAGTLTVRDQADITLETGDDGFHSDEMLSIEGGKINITKSYEGLEGVFIKISGGEISVVASDDGLNAAGGTTADTDFPFQGPPMEGVAETLEEATYYVHITGGTLTVDAGGDGLDSNGAMYIDGGDIYVSGPSGSMNGGLDYTTTGQINGGNVVVTEITSMAENFDSTSSQVSFMYGLSSTMEAGTTVKLTDKDGTVLVERETIKEFNCVTISLPELKVGETYTLTCGEESMEVEITDTISRLGSSGFGFGGPGGGGPGGGPGGPGGGMPGGRGPM